MDNSVSVTRSRAIKSETLFSNGIDETFNLIKSCNNNGRPPRSSPYVKFHEKFLCDKFLRLGGKKQWETRGRHDLLLTSIYRCLRRDSTKSIYRIPGIYLYTPVLFRYTKRGVECRISERFGVCVKPGASPQNILITAREPERLRGEIAGTGRPETKQLFFRKVSIW